ncbi:MAG: hypothetical protein WCI11_18430 [Candidatus Methylumidiphilus sp.]
MIFIQRGAEPEILNLVGQDKIRALCEEYNQGKRTFESDSFDSKVYGHQTVKQALILMQHGKCCFCESKILHIAYGDVEHYRPKAGYRQNSEDAMQKPGYYWLAYSWDNLLLSCERCNRQYKKNLFPLLHEQKRAQCHHDDIDMEKPLLINPTSTDPKNHIGFRDEIPYPIDDSPYGNTTIAVLGLDREELNEIRRTKLEELRRLVDLIKLAEAMPNQEELKQLAENAQMFLLKSMLPQTEYSSMLAANLI